jgi:hypothetical protein
MTKRLTYVKIHLPYFQQGDDFNCFLEKTNNNIFDALDMHMKMLDSAITQLREIKNILKESGKDDFYIEADTHSIGLCGSPDVLEKLFKAKVVELIMFDDQGTPWDNDYDYRDNKGEENDSESME